ncbi:MAG: type II toxin-antitoxin system VapC family toxin [Tannerellaceae bacterium]|nr:type II toxin-antitoxin system VapC family toxin [Tannerellaceae bacterium]
MILCDSNILIDVYRGNAFLTAVLQRMEKLVVVSDVTRAELFFGARNKAELNYIRKEFAKLSVLTINPDISTIGVDLVETYCLSHKLDFLDALIAATAIYHDVELYTLNKKDFIFIPGLKLYQP